MTDTPELLRAHHLKTLKLPTFLREYDKLARQCAAEGLDHVRFLARLVELELIDRERRMIERRIKAAKFPAVKSLPSQACCACPAGQRISFDFKAIPALNKMQVLELARCEWIDRRENVIAPGPSGTGKTHVALGLGLAVCQKGLSVGFITAAALVHELMEARDERRLLRLQKQMANCKLLIIDELGFVPLSKTGAEVLFELISQRYERGATLITSNLPFDEWTETFGSERLTGALLDRLTHHVNILEMNGDSYRLAQSRGRKGIAINQGQDRLALAGQSAQAPASYIESAGTWAPSAFLVPDSGTLKWPTFAPSEAWVDGHVHAFAFFGRVPVSVLYDNDRCLVASILPDGTRKRAKLFSGFLSHYLIRDRYGRPGKGNDKGGVEGLVGYARRNFMVPPLMHVNMHCRAVGAAVPVVGRVQPLSRRAMPQATGGDFARSR